MSAGDKSGKRAESPIFLTLKRATLPIIALCSLSACGTESSPQFQGFNWPETYEKWAPRWHNSGWIIALRASSRTTPETQLQNLFQGEPFVQYSDAIQKEISPEVLSLARSAHAEEISLALISTSELEKRLTLENQTNGLSLIESKRRSVRALFQTISSLPDVAWVEPDLESDLLETSPTFPTGDQMEPWSRMKVQETYAYLAEKNIIPREINVAILDTGVDSLHPSLVRSMFENSSEKNGKPDVDDDNNGYVDDINGIDATLERGKRDTSPEPRPGSADLGGPGSKCPAQSNHELSRNCGHGTHVAGIIGAKIRSSGIMAGVCQSCKIISLRVSSRIRSKGLEFNGPISDSSQIRAINYILRLTDPKDSSRLLTNVVNMSLGKYFQSRSMSYLLRQLQQQNIAVVAAAGNDDSDLPSYPAAYDSVVGVCALGSDGLSFGNGFHRGKFGKAIFSNFGTWVDICAPGVDILSTVPSDGVTPLHEIKSGTSQATPFVAGAMALLLGISSAGETVQTESLLKILQDTADSQSVYGAKYNLNLYDKRYPDGVSAYYLGAGIVNLLNAVKMAVDDPSGSRTSEYKAPPESNAMNGCVMNSIVLKRGGLLGFSESLLALLPGLWVVVRWGRKQLRHKG